MRVGVIPFLAVLGCFSAVATPLSQRATAPQPAKGKSTPPTKPKDAKYFREAGRTLTTIHYDIRYFHEPLEYEEHRVVLRNLIRSYLSVTNRLHVDSWIAHGTLLGWFWNQKIMPWDYDIDVQISNDTMHWVANHLNRTEHDFNHTDDAGQERTERYLFDVNPHWHEPRGDGRNIIDARWIDMSNGAFIDITGVAVRETEKKPDEWSCRNYHRYKEADLFPLHQTQFEGIPAYVPRNSEPILHKEYSNKSTTRTEWKGHKFDPEQMEWFKVQKIDDKKKDDGKKKDGEKKEGEKKKDDGKKTDEAKKEQDGKKNDEKKN